MARRPRGGRAGATDRIMTITLEQAIEIHAKALRYRHGLKAPRMAREKAAQLGSIGDREGLAVWIKVAEAAEALPAETLSH